MYRVLSHCFVRVGTILFPSVFWGNCYRMKENEGVREGTGMKLKTSDKEYPMYTLRHICWAHSAVCLSGDSWGTCSETSQAVISSSAYAVPGISFCICNWQIFHWKKPKKHQNPNLSSFSWEVCVLPFSSCYTKMMDMYSLPETSCLLLTGSSFAFPLPLKCSQLSCNWGKNYSGGFYKR